MPATTANMHACPHMGTRAAPKPVAAGMDGIPIHQPGGVGVVQEAAVHLSIVACATEGSSTHRLS